MLITGILDGSACVPRDRYDSAVKNAETLRAESHQRGVEVARLKAEIDRLNAEIAAARARLDQEDQAAAGTDVALHDLQVKLDDATVLSEQLRLALERQGKNADTLLAEKGNMATALAEAKQRLDELRKAQAAADKRTALYRDLALRFQKMIDSGQLKVSLRNGRMVIELANDVLFDSGQTRLKAEGQRALSEVAKVLATIPDRRFQVAGNTDNVPIEKAAFGSNWDLSAARSVEVVRFLVKKGVKPGLLSAAGYGEFDPVAPNATPEGRARNRRIEITLQPNIDELVAVPGAPK